MTINFRDPADKIGAALGFVIGISLTAIILISSPFEGLTLNGIIFPQTPFIKVVTFLLIIGICINLTRNLFVGAHDAFVFVYNFYHRVRKRI